MARPMLLGRRHHRTKGSLSSLSSVATSTEPTTTRKKSRIYQARKAIEASPIAVAARLTNSVIPKLMSPG